MTNEELAARGITITAPVSTEKWNPPAIGIRSPWEMQRLIMEKSDQPTPATTTIHNASLLYGALMLEEMGEFVGALKAVTDKAVMPDATMNIVALKYVERFMSLRKLLDSTALGMKIVSEQIRSFVANPNHPELNFPDGLAEDAVVELLDGVSDLMVTAAGFSIVSGLPGQKAFLQVCVSNLSKANPETGKIDKDAGGKWIKGPNYVEPNLAALLAGDPLMRASSTQE